MATNQESVSFSRVEDLGLVTRTIYNTAQGAILGGLVYGGLKAISRGRAPAHAALEVVPLFAGAGFLYTLTSGIVENGRGKADGVSAFTGGLVAGSVLFGVRRGVVAGAIGGVLTGIAAAGPDISASATATVAEEKAGGPVAVPVGADEAARNARASVNFVRRLQ